MSGKNFFLYSLLLSFIINFLLYFIFENKLAIGQGAYCQPLPYLTFSGPWPGQGYLVMTSSTPNVLVRYAGGTLITGSGSANYISKWTSASTLGNSIIYDNGTNVGIGTIKPAYKLDVSGDVRVTGTLYAGAISGTYTGTINAANVSAGQFGANTGGGNYSFPGNVGIGTAATTAKLHILDGIATSTKLAINNAEGSSGLAFYSPITSNFGWTRYEFGQGYKPGPSDGYYTITSQYNFTGIRDRNGSLQFIAALSPGANTIVTDADFNSSYVRMTIANNGNVGIGTTAPGYKLHVYGQGHFSRDNANECCSAGDFTLSVAENTAGTGRKATIEFHNSGYSEGYIRLDGGGSDRRLVLGDHQNWGMGLEINGNTNIKASPNQAGNLYVAGNVGIGTTAPGSGLGSPRPNLDVTGFIAFNRNHSWDGDTYARWGAFRKVRLTSSPYIEIQAEDGNLYGINIWLSTEKAKTNISNLGIDSNKIYKLRPVSFNWKTQPDAPKTFGLIAEETAQVIPELVSYDEKNNPHYVKYELLSVLLLDQLQKIRNEGLILKDADGPGCHKITVNSNGEIMTTSVPCQ
jgi:hypothetical protein